MRVSMITLFILLLLSACGPSSPDLLPLLKISPTSSSPTVVLEITPPTPIPDPTQTASITLPVPTDELPESLLSTATPTPFPDVFDLNGYKGFAVSRSYFPGFEQYWDQGYFTVINNAFNPSGDRIAVSACWGNISNTHVCEGTDSGLLLVLDTITGNLVTEIPLGSSWPGGIAFSADGQTLLYGTTEKIALWDLALNSPGLTLIDRAGSGRQRFPAVAAAPDGQSYAALVGQTLYVWDLSGQLLLQRPAALTRFGDASIAYSANGARIAFISPGLAEVEVYDTSNWELIRKIESEHTFDIAFSPDAHLLAAIDYESDTATIWDLDTGDQIVEIDPDQEVGYIRFNPAGDLLVIAGPGKIDTPDQYARIGTLYETNQWSLLEHLYSFIDWGRIEFSQDGKRMAVMGEFSKAIYEHANPELIEGYETLHEFQNALHSGDFARAAALFEYDLRDEEFWKELGLQPDDVAGSFERMCAGEVIYCYPVRELVTMGYDWEALVYLVRLDNNGTPVTGENGSQLFTFYLGNSSDELKLVFLPYDR